MYGRPEGSPLAAQGYRMELRDRIDRCEAKVGIIGMGYVGLPLARTFWAKGFGVTGFDVEVGKLTVVEFTPDRTGQFFITHHQHGHAIIAKLLVEP